MTMLSRVGPVPLYYQLKTVILREIESGRWPPDAQLPSENELAGRFSVSKITVRQALRELAGEGFIRREQGRGTFVERRRLQQGPRELTSFTKEMRSHGLVPASRVLERGVVAAPPAVVSALGLSEDARVFRLRRLRLANREPMGVQTAFIPLDLTPGIAEISFAGVSLYDVLQSHFGLYPATARETYRVTLLKRDVAALLSVSARSPAMTAERVTFLADGRPLEYVQSIMRGDRYMVAIDLTRHPSRPG